MVRSLNSHQCGLGLFPRLGVVIWVEFVGSLLHSKRFFLGYSGFPFVKNLKTNSRFDFREFNLISVYSIPNLIVLNTS